jgi:hypothetical protein
VGRATADGHHLPFRIISGLSPLWSPGQEDVRGLAPECAGRYVSRAGGLLPLDMADRLSGGGVTVARLLLALAGRLEKGRRAGAGTGLVVPVRAASSAASATRMALTPCSTGVTLAGFPRTVSRQASCSASSGSPVPSSRSVVRVECQCNFHKRKLL